MNKTAFFALIMGASIITSGQNWLVLATDSGNSQAWIKGPSDGLEVYWSDDKNAVVDRKGNVLPEFNAPSVEIKLPKKA